MRSSSMILLGAIALVAALSVVNQVGVPHPALIEPAVAATPVAPPVSAFRTVTSSTCSSNGCPTSCEADEALISAICIGPSSAKFSDNLSLENGQMTASCGPSSSTIVVSCARK
ncbi:hypothetical protein [Rhodopseudomonas palustris]|uniref:hypothetical protein n=1 Tax=Rhodopseudomonas TaxID=1073 RepID=UPI0021F36D29|nr:hypothetical protein [Rhodopseudomonas palustris]UYO49156.1 hypothetical protein KQX64_00485 [Rhodopseudomonas palustris]UYO53927.1 hypothetical protein KQX61_00485 [Rhodopseudomonas palustris]